MSNQNCSMKEIMQKLKAPFPSNDIEWRVNRSGISNGKAWAMVLAYVDNRAIQNRLDDVFGPGGWKNSFEDFQGGILCTISCFIDGQWVSKTDGAEKTDIESLKGGLSSAMKRCGAQWGIGRYLYNLEENFVEISPQKLPGAKYIHDKKNNIKGYWVPPKLPDWALPEEERSQYNQQQTQDQSNQTDPSNRNKLILNLKEFIKKIGFKEEVLVLRFFNSINPKMNQNSVLEVFKKASDKELFCYYNAMKPTADLVTISNHYKVPMEKVMYYVQILFPQVKLKSLFHCLGVVQKEHVKKVIEFIKEELNDGSQEIA